MTSNINNTELPPPQQRKKKTNIAAEVFPPPINVENFNCLNKLYRVTAYTIRFVNNFVSKFRPNVKCRTGVADYFDSLGKMTPPVKIYQRKVTPVELK